MMMAGVDNLKRLSLATEASMADDIETADNFAEVLTSAHAPALKDGLRLNIAATDDVFRQISVNHVLSYIEMARRYPNVQQVNIHPPPRQWLDEGQTAGRYGDYGRLVDGMRQIADYAADWGIEIVVENLNAYFTGVPDDIPPDQIDWTDRNQAYGSSPDEWIQICKDVDRPNVGLCLDSSHSCTYAHTFPEDRRHDLVMGFLAEPDLIRHVHWNDNYLYDVRGRQDSHALIGKGTLPVELHRAIKKLDATIVIEHFYTIEDLEEELEYIECL